MAKPTNGCVHEVEEALKKRSLNERLDLLTVIFLQAAKKGDEGKADRDYVRDQLLELLDRVGKPEHKLDNGEGIERREDTPKLSSNPLERNRQVQALERYAKRKYGKKAPKPISKHPSIEYEINQGFLEFIKDKPDAIRRLKQIVPPVVKLCRTGKGCEG